MSLKVQYNEIDSKIPLKQQTLLLEM